MRVLCQAMFMPCKVLMLDARVLLLLLRLPTVLLLLLLLNLLLLLKLLPLLLLGTSPVLHYLYLPPEACGWCSSPSGFVLWMSVSIFRLELILAPCIDGHMTGRSLRRSQD
jgi:hypothetical protein